MNNELCVETLVASGDIPEDAEIVSTNNKVVIISQSESLVARIGSISDAKLRDDPHDLGYSHTVSWLAGDSAPVVQPLHEQPLVRGDYVISSYPLLSSDVELGTSSAVAIHDMLRDFGKALPVVTGSMALRRLNVSAYVNERLKYMCDNPFYDERLVGYVQHETAKMDERYPFEQLTQNDAALVHGDLKVDNIVVDVDGSLKAIDLDAAAVGPRLYDIASWRLRSELGDNAPVELVAEAGRRESEWDEEAYRALIGWKAISSLSFTLRYEAAEIYSQKTAAIADSAVRLGGLTTALARAS